MATHSTTVDLDSQGYYPLRLEYNRDAQKLTVHIGSSMQNASGRFRYNFRKLLNVTADDGKANDDITKHASSDHETITFENVPEHFTLQLGARLLGTFESGEEALTHTAYVPLTVSHKRMTGSYHLSKIAHFNTGPKRTKKETPKQTLEKYSAAIKEAENYIIGDFHTHSSGAIYAKGLLDIAEKHDAYYPIYLLEKFGIAVSEDRKTKVGTKLLPRVKFRPLEPQNLPDEVECIPVKAFTSDERAKLERLMALPDSEIATYYEMEVPAYETRYPLTKNPVILRESIKKAAQEAADQGLDFIELSYVGLEDPAIFKAVHETIRDIEKDPELNITVRLKYGLPRTNSQPQLRALLEKAKVITQSPYVTGIDILGYEDNKTHAFEDDLNDFADWVSRENPDLMLSIHAGENNKNIGNVYRALQFAKDNDVTVRIGHGIYGLEDPETLKLATELAKQDPPRIYIELNPDSNIALNNLMDPSDLNWRNFIGEGIDKGIPFVPGSDSYGHYQTSRKQLAATFVDSGMDQKALETMRNHQQALRQRVVTHSNEKAKPIEQWETDTGLQAFIDETNEKVAKVAGPSKGQSGYEFSKDEVERFLESQGVPLIQTLEEVPKIEALKDKNPILVWGAEGSSWDTISPGHQHQIAVAYHMLAQAMDPEKVYFAQGRNKPKNPAGITRVLNDTVKKINDRAGESGPTFKSIGLRADIKPNEEARGEFAHLDYMVHIKDRTHIAEDMTRFAVENNGIIVCAGGAAYTNDAILKSDLRMKQEDKGTLLVMDGPKGASSNKARGLSDSYLFMDGKELLLKIYLNHPEFFKAGIREQLEDDIKGLLASEFNEEPKALDHQAIQEALKNRDIRKIVLNDQKGVLAGIYDAADYYIDGKYGKPDPQDQTVTATQTLQTQRKNGRS